MLLTCACLNAGMRSFTVNTVGPFSLRAAIGFLDSFGAAGFATAHGHLLDLACTADRDWHPVGVQLAQRGTALNGQFWGDGEAEHVRSQVQRILSLDTDATPFADVGDADPVVAAVQARFPGLRPVCFWSPYEAACWAVIGLGISLREASAAKARITAEIGPDVPIGPGTLRCFPAPEQLAALTEFPGLASEKVEWLRGVARHALAGDFDAFLLRDLPRDDAVAHLERIPGLRGFPAELVLVRGAGDPDFPPSAEPRLAVAVSRAYDLPAPPTQAELDRITERWRPYRSWVAFLMRRTLDE